MPEPRRILLVEDDDDIRELCRTVLEMVGGYRVETARSGMEGLELAGTNPPDAILLDVMMPGLDGPGTLTRLREQEQTRSVPVIFLTAKTQESERRRFMSLGASAVLTKPFDALALSGQIAEILGWDGD